MEKAELTPDGNLFRQAKQLLDRKSGPQMTEEEAKVIQTAIIPLLLIPAFGDITIGEGLEELAKMVEGGHG